MTNSGAKAASRTSSSRSTSQSGSRPSSGRRASAKKEPVPPDVPGVARIIAIANQKGGVGKSTTAVSLGASLADLGYRVLVIDLDPQGNASTGLGIRHEARETTVYHVIVAESPIDDAIVHTAVERLHAVPSTIDLAGAEIELVSQFSRETRLKKALDPVREGRYDFVLVDCPPSLGLLTINALTAAEELIVPIQCEYYALEGLGQLLRNVSLVQQNINPDLRLSGIVMTMFDPRTKLSEQVVAEVQRFFGDLVYDVIIPRTVRLSEAPGFGQPISVYDPKSKGAQTYRQLAGEVASRPPPAGPMPVYDDLPMVVVPAVVDTVTPESLGEEELEELPIPTVHEVVEEAEAEVEAESAVSEVAVETGKRPTRSDVKDRPTPRRAGPPASQKQAKTQVAPLVADEDDIWEDLADESVPPSEPPTGATPRTQPSSVASSPAPAPPAHPSGSQPGSEAGSQAGSRPERRPERRVVVIDENAELEASSRPASLDAVPNEPSSSPAVAAIGATLEEEGHSKRRWRLFRKGGE